MFSASGLLHFPLSPSKGMEEKLFFRKGEINQLHLTNASLSSAKILLGVEMSWNPISWACQKNAVSFNFERNIHGAAAGMEFVTNGTCLSSSCKTKSPQSVWVSFADLFCQHCYHSKITSIFFPDECWWWYWIKKLLSFWKCEQNQSLQYEKVSLAVPKRDTFPYWLYFLTVNGENSQRRSQSQMKRIFETESRGIRYWKKMLDNGSGLGTRRALGMCWRPVLPPS